MAAANREDMYDKQQFLVAAAGAPSFNLDDSTSGVTWATSMTTASPPTRAVTYSMADLGTKLPLNRP